MRQDKKVTSDSLKIRKYISRDKKGVIRLLEMNTPRYFAESEKVDFDKYLDEKVEDYFVVESNNKIIGAGGINYFLPDKIARISWDMIHPNHQNKGIGRELVQHRLSLLNQKNDIESIVVRTTQHVQLFYSKMNFNLTKVEKNYWAEGFDLYYMEQDN